MTMPQETWFSWRPRTFKRTDRRYGPFEVTKKVSQAAYKLKLPTTWKAVYPIFHDSYLMPYRKLVYTSQQPPPHPPPILVDGEPEFKVESVLDERMWRRRLEYLVHWKGYRREHNTWEAAANLENAAEVVRDFYDQGPDTPVSAMKIRAVTFEAFGCHLCLFHPLDGTPGEGFAVPDWYYSQHDWMLTVDPEFVNRMVEGPQDGWQDQLLGGADRIWLVEPADETSRRREMKIKYVVILGQDDRPVQLYRLMNPM
jgi:hypothetical protein